MDNFKSYMAGREEGGSNIVPPSKEQSPGMAEDLSLDKMLCQGEEEYGLSNLFLENLKVEEEKEEKEEVMETDQVEESEPASGEPERDGQFAGNCVSNQEKFKVVI